MKGELCMWGHVGAWVWRSPFPDSRVPTWKGVEENRDEGGKGIVSILI